MNTYWVQLPAQTSLCFSGNNRRHVVVVAIIVVFFPQLVMVTFHDYSDLKQMRTGNRLTHKYPWIHLGQLPYREKNSSPVQTSPRVQNFVLWDSGQVYFNNLT